MERLIKIKIWQTRIVPSCQQESLCYKYLISSKNRKPSNHIYLFIRIVIGLDNDVIVYNSSLNLEDEILIFLYFS